MFGKRSHGATMRFFLWAAFYINLSLFPIAIIWKLDFLMIVSITVSLMVIITKKKHQLFSSAIRLNSSYSQNKRSFFGYLHGLVSKKKNEVEFLNKEGTPGSSIQFSPNPDFSKQEAVLHAVSPVKVNDHKLTVKTGSRQCTHPFKDSILGIDIPEFSLMNLEMFKGLDLASHTGNFSIGITDSDLEKVGNGNCILKLSIDKHNEFNDSEKLHSHMEKIAALNSVKGVEIVLFKMFSTFYSLSDMMDKKNNDHFNNTRELLEFIQKIRFLSKGKPIGIRTGIRDKNEMIELIRTIKETGIMPDFITVTGEESRNLSLDEPEKIQYPPSELSLDFAIAFVHTQLKKHKLDKEVQLWAAGTMDNGFDLLKLIALGADKCISVRSSRFYNQISDNYFFDDSETVIKSSILFTYRNIIREAVQIMEYAGFASPEQVSPKMFFRKLNKSTIKSFDEIYFKPRSSSNWGIFEDYIHLN